MRVDDLVEHYRSYPEVAFIAISERQAALAPELPWARTIHHGLDPELYAAGSGDGGYVAFLGRFAAEKAPHLAIDAARAAGVRLLLGGNAHAIPEAQAYFERELRPRLADATNLEACGELSHGPKVRLLSGARALLFPIEWEEPFGLVMIESMLVGTPVIAFARGSAPEVIEDGVTGYLVHDAAEMAERIRQLDRIDRTRCRARAQERWSVTRMAKDYADVYAQLAQRSARATRVVPLERVGANAPARSHALADELPRAAGGKEHGA
jgi:glycosyltransferase involved in cell wall biosynthesis